MFDKTQDIYVKATVIQNGVPDVHGDILDSKEIKQIFTSFNNQNNFEVNHEGLPIEGVTLLENYISKTDETIGTTTVPSGSWNVVMKISSPEYQKGITDGTYGGVSLSNRVKKECNCQLHGNIRYKDLPSAECVIPMYISLVDEGANGVGLEIFDYDAYILKSKGSHKMNLLEELKALVQKAEVTETPVIKKGASEEVDVQEEQSTEQVDKTPEEEPKESEDKEAEDKEGEEAKEPKEEAEEEDESAIKKSCDEEIKKQANDEGPSIEERIAKIEKAIASLIKEDDEMVSTIEKYVERYNRLRDYMFGYPANLVPDSAITKYCRGKETQLSIMNNCADTYEQGNYQMDSKESFKN